MVELNPFDQDMADPNRQTLLDTFGQEGFAAGFKQLGQMVTPQSLYGGASVDTVMNDFVEFSPYGDVKDALSGFNPKSGLDPLERSLALLPVAGFTVGGWKLGQALLNHWQAEKLRSQQVASMQIAPLYMPGEGFPDPLAEVDPSARRDGLGDSTLTPQEQQRANQLRQLEHIIYGTDNTLTHRGRILTAPDWDTLVDVIGGDYDKSRRTLEAIGNGVIRETGDAFMNAVDQKGNPIPKDYVTFTAAKYALASWRTAQDQGALIMFDDQGQYMVPDMVEDVGRMFDSRDLHRVVQLQAALTRYAVGPDLVVTPQVEIAGVVFNDADIFAPPVVMLGVRALPNQRVFGPDGELLITQDQLADRMWNLNPEALIGDFAANIIKGVTEAEKSPGAALRGKTWYRRANNSILRFSEMTGADPGTVSAVISGMSMRTNWLPDNLVGALHVMMRYTLPDLDPHSPEYRQIIKDTLEAGMWGRELRDSSSQELRKHLGEDPKAYIEYFSNVDSVANTKGSSMGQTLEKQRQNVIDLMIEGLPPDLVLRMAKTNNFATNLNDPGRFDPVTIDAHSDSLLWGTVHSPEPIGSKTQQNTVFRIDNIMAMDRDVVLRTAPGSKNDVTAGDLQDVVRRMREDGVPDADIEKRLKNVQLVPHPRSARVYQAQVEAHHVAARELGVETGNKVQSESWGPMKANRASKDVLIHDKSIPAHIEANPLYQKTPLGYTANASPELRSAVPEGTVSSRKSKPDAKGDPAHPIVVFGKGDGTTEVWADLTVPGVEDSLRHLVPAGPVEGPFSRMVPREARQVPMVETELGRLAEQVDDRGIPVAAESRTFVGDEHPALKPGNRMVIEALDADAAAEIQMIAETAEVPLKVTTRPVAHRRAGQSRESLTASEVTQMGRAGLVNPHTSPLVTSDWIAISAFQNEGQLPGVTPGKNRARNRALKQRLITKVRQMNNVSRAEAEAMVHETTGRYDGEVEDSFVVFGLDYQSALELAEAFNQNSVATRNGLIYPVYDPKTGKPTGEYTMNPATGEFEFADASLEGADNWTQFHLPESEGEYGMSASYNAGYDFDTQVPVQGALNDLMGSSAQQSPSSRVQVEIELGGLDTHVPWHVTDQVWNEIQASGKAASSSAYVHGDLWRPPGTTRVGEHVVQGGGQTASWRSKNATEGAATVDVPHAEAAGLGRATGQESAVYRTKEAAADKLLADAAEGQQVFEIPGEIVIDVPDLNPRVIEQGLPVLEWSEELRQGAQFKLVFNEGGPPVLTWDEGSPGYRQGFTRPDNEVMVVPNRSGGRTTLHEIRTTNPDLVGPSRQALAAIGYPLESSEQVFVESVQRPADVMNVIRPPDRQAWELHEAKTSPFIEVEEKNFGNPDRPPQYETRERDLGLKAELETRLGGEVARFELFDDVSESVAQEVVDTVVGMTGKSDRYVQFVEETGGVHPSVFQSKHLPGGIFAGTIDMSHVMGATELGGRYRAQRQVVLSTQYMQAVEFLGAERLRGVKQEVRGRYNYAADGVHPIEGVMIHEAGHVVHSAVALFDTDLLVALDDRVWNVIAGLPTIERDAISRYAQRSQFEFFAEAFYQVVSGDPNVNPEVKRLVNDVVRATHLMEGKVASPELKSLIEGTYDGS